MFKLKNKHSIDITFINKGFHSYTNKEAGGWLLSLFFVYKCIIPKGSEFYYDNANEEYVSNQLIIKKLI